MTEGVFIAAFAPHEILCGVKFLAAIGAAVLAVVGLTGCHTNIGTAAWVNTHRITESAVNTYVSPAGISQKALSQAKSQGGSIPPPRTFVLQFLVQEQVFAQTLQHFKIPYTEGGLAATHDAAASLLLNTQLAGSNLDAIIDKQLPSSGVRRSFRDVFLRVLELEYRVVKSKHLTQFSQLPPLVKQAKVSVWVSPRYGSWHWNSLSISGNTVPSYLSLHSAGSTQ